METHRKSNTDRMKNGLEDSRIDRLDVFSKKKLLMKEVRPRVFELCRLRKAYSKRFNDHKPVTKLKRRMRAIIKEIRHTIYAMSVEWQLADDGADLSSVLVTLERFNDIYIAPIERMKEARELRELAVNVKHSGRVSHEHGVKVMLELPAQIAVGGGESVSGGAGNSEDNIIDGEVVG